MEYMKKMKSFEESKIDDIVDEFIKLYKQAKKYARIADYRSKHDNSDYLAGGKELEESEKLDESINLLKQHNLLDDD